MPRRSRRRLHRADDQAAFVRSAVVFGIQFQARRSSIRLIGVCPETIRSVTSTSQRYGSIPLSLAVSINDAMVAQCFGSGVGAGEEWFLR